MKTHLLVSSFHDIFLLNMACKTVLSIASTTGINTIAMRSGASVRIDFKHPELIDAEDVELVRRVLVKVGADRGWRVEVLND